MLEYFILEVVLD